ncbi:MAG: O-antigen ligase family protein, partial [Terriglobia bacterium]
GGLFLLAFGASLAFGWAAYSGQAALSLALLVAAGGFLFVVSRPDFGILILLSTMLFTYPDILQGQGLLTINNLLGFMFALLLAGRVFSSHDLWFLREREVRIFLSIAVLFLVTTLAAEYFLPKLTYPVVISEEGIIAKDLTVGRLKDFFSRLAFFIFLINFITTRRQFLAVLLLLAGCILLVIPPAIQVYLSGTAVEQRVTAGSLFGGGSGWLSNPNRFAFMCLVGTTLLFYFAMAARRPILKSLLILVALPLPVLALLSGSRSGLLGLIITLGWLLSVRRQGAPQYGLRIGTGLLGVSAIVAFLLLAPPIIQQRLLNLNPLNPEGEGTNSTEVRAATAEQSLAIFAQYPVVGIGIGNFRWMNAYLHGNHRPPHNSY